jgi:hypothetical protein
VDAFSGLAPFAQISAAGALLAVTIYIIRVVVRGDFVPRRTVDAMLTARDAEITRANQRGDDWHSAYENERHAREVIVAQNGELIEVAHTVQHVMEVLEERSRASG